MGAYVLSTHLFNCCQMELANALPQIRDAITLLNSRESTEKQQVKAL